MVLVLTTVSRSDEAAKSIGEGLEPDNDNKLETMSGPFRLPVEDPLGSSNISNRLFPVLLLIVGGGIGLGSGEGGAGQTPHVAALSSRFNVCWSDSACLGLLACRVGNTGLIKGTGWVGYNMH